jgi:cation diffusion facilitator CzcD-associated flavoprotein CzcO
VGILNKWKWPEIEGFNECEVQKVHSAAWDPEITWAGKNVAVIGAGSSGIQIVPAIQPTVKRLDHYMSGKTWISPIGFGSDELVARGAIGNCEYWELQPI